mmetsp:Transcript_6889/g.17148  ORF Transcript_6889/g.17148 Transcript_6889/m.17148 type:complete len:296 (-) Transcript_6889:705-1592(-)
MLSCAFALHPRTMYVGSMYLTSQLISALRRLQNHGPMSPSTGLPPASVPPAPMTYSCPAPSASTTTAYPCDATRFFMCATAPLGPSIAKSTSGMRHTSVSPLASAAFMAMKPDCRPISFTTPMPFSADRASVAAALIAFCASSTAVSKPKVLSMCRMSLSMVFGIPTTLTFRPRLAHSWLMALAPACDPFPPMTKIMFMPCRSMAFTIWFTSPPPRPHPTIEPPWDWMFRTVLRLSGKFSTPSLKNPLNPNLMPLIFLTSYPTSSVLTSERITSLIPGHSPPQFTMAAWTSEGLK